MARAGAKGLEGERNGDGEEWEGRETSMSGVCTAASAVRSVGCSNSGEVLFGLAAS